MTGPQAWELPGGTGASWALDRAFRYGMSVFETIAIADGRPLFLDEHLARLRAAAEALLGNAPPGAGSPEACSGDGVLRLYITAGPGALDAPATEPATLAIFEPCAVLAGPGAGAALVFSRAVHVPAPGGWKTGNYWSNLRALGQARAAKADEAVLFGPDRVAIGCACANLFVVRDGIVRTPARSFGARDGVVRSWVAGEIAIEEAALDAQDLLEADEVFFTNSRVGIAAARSIEGRVLPSRATASALAAAYARDILQR